MALHCYLTLFCLVSLTNGDWLDGNDGVDRPGGDVGKVIVLGDEGVPRECAGYCNVIPDCKAWVYVKPRCDAPDVVPTCFFKRSVSNQVRNLCRVSGLQGPPRLVPLKFKPFPLGAIKPKGWLLDVLRIQADGLSGNLPYFWPDVMKSIWMGGSADGGLHERTPYWLDGVLPLAYQLDDRELIKLVRNYTNYILDHQHEDGWLGPDDQPSSGDQYWSRYLIMFILRQYHEANPMEARVVPAMMKYVRQMYKRMFDVPLSAPSGGDTWGAARWQEMAMTLHWLLENYSEGQEQMLWDMAELMNEQGFHWKDWYRSTGGFVFPKGSVNSNDNYHTHGVNNAMAYKSEAVWYRQSHDHDDVASTYQRVRILDQYHGQATGMFGCDEHLAGSMPSRGSELCSVVESMFSFEVMHSILGDPMFAERAEQLAYNALPATLTSDMWAHQYIQQTNQMMSGHSLHHVWIFDGPDANIFGLSPNYGCCTANFNQGWPKFTQHVMSAVTNGEGVAISMYAPALLNYTLPSGVHVVIDIITDYPFDGKVTIKASCGSGIVLLLRIPSWTHDPVLTVNGKDNPTGPPQPGTMHEVICIGTTDVRILFPMRIKVVRRFNEAAAVYRGPLLYALQLEETKEVTKIYFTPRDKSSGRSVDFVMKSNGTWNYAIYLPNCQSINELMKVKNRSLVSGFSPFSLSNVPIKIFAMGKKLDSWVVKQSSAAAPPQSPVVSLRDMEPISLVPYGATNLRITEMPVLED